MGAHISVRKTLNSGSQMNAGNVGKPSLIFSKPQINPSFQKHEQNHYSIPINLRDYEEYFSYHQSFFQT
jgi:hypothetical protein